MEGGDELLNSELYPHCGDVIYIDQEIEWIDEAQRIARCPNCRGEMEIS